MLHVGLDLSRKRLDLHGAQPSDTNLTQKPREEA